MKCEDLEQQLKCEQNVNTGTLLVTSLLRHGRYWMLSWGEHGKLQVWACGRQSGHVEGKVILTSQGLGTQFLRHWRFSLSQHFSRGDGMTLSANYSSCSLFTNAFDSVIMLMRF